MPPVNTFSLTLRPPPDGLEVAVVIDTDHHVHVFRVHAPDTSPASINRMVPMINALRELAERRKVLLFFAGPKFKLFLNDGRQALPLDVLYPPPPAAGAH